jgi:thymidine kinase
MESLGMKSITPAASVFTPRVAATSVMFADNIAAMDAVCSQCDPNGSHW